MFYVGIFLVVVLVLTVLAALWILAPWWTIGGILLVLVLIFYIWQRNTPSARARRATAPGRGPDVIGYKVVTLIAIIALAGLAAWQGASWLTRPRVAQPQTKSEAEVRVETEARLAVMRDAMEKKEKWEEILLSPGETFKKLVPPGDNFDWQPSPIDVDSEVYDADGAHWVLATNKTKRNAILRYRIYPCIKGVTSERCR